MFLGSLKSIIWICRSYLLNSTGYESVIFSLEYEDLATGSFFSRFFSKKTTPSRIPIRCPHTAEPFNTAPMTGSVHLFVVKTWGRGPVALEEMSDLKGTMLPGKVPFWYAFIFDHFLP